MGTAKYEDSHLIDMLRESLNKKEILIPWFRYCQSERSALYLAAGKKEKKAKTTSANYVDIPTAHTFLSMLARTPLLPSKKKVVLPLPSEGLTGKTTVITFNDKNENEERDEPNVYYININPRLSQFPSGDPDIKLNYTKIDRKNVAVLFGDDTQHVIFKLHVIYWLHAFMIPEPEPEDYDDEYKRIIPKQRFRIGQAAVTVFGGDGFRDLFPFSVDAKKFPPKTVLFVDIHDDLHDHPPKPIVQRTLEFEDGIFQQSYDSDYDKATGRGRYFTSALYNWLHLNARYYEYVVLPDKGAKARFLPMLQTHFTNDKIFYCNARRDSAGKTLEPLAEVEDGAINKMREAVTNDGTLRFLIVDDFTMSGGTLNTAAGRIHEAVQNGGALDIDAWVTHATFNYDPNVTVAKINEPDEARHNWKINHLFMTDSCPMTTKAQEVAERSSGKLQITIEPLDRLIGDN